MSEDRQQSCVKFERLRFVKTTCVPKECRSEILSVFLEILLSGCWADGTVCRIAAEREDCEVVAGFDRITDDNLSFGLWSGDIDVVMMC